MKIQITIIAVSLFFFCSLTNAQWVQTRLTSSKVNTIVVSNTTLYAGTNGDGIYISTDNALNWSAVNNGLRILLFDLLKLSVKTFLQGLMAVVYFVRPIMAQAGIQPITE